MTNQNKELLKSFTDYCTSHPEERFWQALRNWSDYNFIYVTNNPPWDSAKLLDTFYWTQKKG